MNVIPRFNSVGDSDPWHGEWCKWSDVEALLAQLPEGMRHCTIRFIECKKGHGRLTATNWIDHGCQTCELEEACAKALAELNDLRTKALAAVWLLPEDVGVQALLELREEARGVFMGKDKQVIAKLQDELHNAQEYARQVQRPPVPGVNSVYGVRQTGRVVDTRYALVVTSINRAPNGGLVIEVQLP